MTRPKLALVLFILGSLTSASALADSPLASRVTDAVLSRLNRMREGVVAPFKEALCVDPGKGGGTSTLRPDGIVLSGELDFAKLLPATRATGLTTSLGGFLWITYARGQDHISVQAFVMPNAGFSLPSAASKEVQAHAYIGLVFNCAANPHVSDYFLEVGAGGPAGLNFFFDLSVQNLFQRAMMAGDASNTPRTYGIIMKTAHAAEPSVGEAVDELDRRSRAIDGGLADRLLSANMRRWPQDDPSVGRPISHWVAETAKAVQATARNSSADSLIRRVEALLTRLKAATGDPFVQGQLQADILNLYQDLGNATHALAVSLFPLTISRDRRAHFARATNMTPRDFLVKRPTGNYRSYCRPTDRFIAVNAFSDGRWTKLYFDCLSDSSLNEAQFASARLWLSANRVLVERADRYRAALGDLTHILNNTYAQYLTGQAVRPESLRVGGVHAGPVFTGCFGVELSVLSLVRSGAALFRAAGALARGALATTPATPAGLVSAMGTGAAGIGLPPWSPSVSIAYSYEIGEPTNIPLSSLPPLWRMVFAGQCE